MIFNVWNNILVQGFEAAANASQMVGEIPLNPLRPPKNTNANCSALSDNKLDGIVFPNIDKAKNQLDMHNHLTEFGNQAIAMISENGIISNKSNNLNELIKLSIEDGEDIISHLHPQHAQAFRNKLFMVINEFENGESCNMRYQLKQYNSEYCWLEFSLAKHASNDSNSCLILITNVDKEIQTERKLRTAQIETELTQKGRDEFLGHMSHELRTPLNAMLGFAEMMERGVYGKVESPEYQEYLSNIRDSGNLLLNRINDMIEVVTSDVSDDCIDESTIQLNHLIDSAIKLHRYDAFCRNITICHPKDLPRIVIRGEYAKLTRALGNLLSNAIRFSQPDQQITIFCNYNLESGLTITVYDNGDGMSEQHIDKINLSLKKPDCLFAQNPESVGVGLGLAVVREFITLHDGDLNIESQKGKGTEASISLPAKRITSLEKPISRRKRRAAVMVN